MVKANSSVILLVVSLLLLVTLGVEGNMNAVVNTPTANLYEVAGGNVPTRDVFEAAIEFAFENEAAFDVFMKARLRQE